MSYISDYDSPTAHSSTLKAQDKPHPLKEQQLARELDESRAIQRALYEISALALEHQLSEDFFRKIHDIISSLMYAENFFVVLQKPEQASFYFPYFVDSVDVDLSPESLRHVPKETLEKSLTGYLLRSGKTQHIDQNTMLALTKSGDIAPIGTNCVDWLGVPIKHKNTILGAIVVQSYLPNVVYEQRHEEILEFVARQIGLVLTWKHYEVALARANSELEQRVEQRTRQLQKINENLKAEIEERKRAEHLQSQLIRITEIANSSEHLDEFFEKLHGIINELTSAPNFFIALVDEDSNMLTFPYYADEREPVPQPRPLDSPEGRTGGLTERVIRTGRSYLYRKDKDGAFPGRGANPYSWLGVPLRFHKHTFGALVVQSYDSNVYYGAAESLLLKYISRHVATVILRRKHEEALVAANQQLKRAQEELEQRVHERTAQLQKTNERLSKALDEKTRIEKQLEHQALHDPLTGLPNRALFMERLNWFVERLKRDARATFSVLFLDLDRFKYVNDSLGHHIGDELLIECTQRIKSCIRSNDLLARLGGDEFCILCDTTDLKVSQKVAERIIHALEKPFFIDRHEIHTSTSIGIRPVTDSRESTSSIMSDADAAMYQAKNQGRSRWTVFDENLSQQIRSRVRLEQELRAALNSDQIFLQFQPIIDFCTQSITGFEALVRWKHPTEGLIPPSIFIPIAEETGLIQPLGRVIFETAVTTLKLWQTHPRLAAMTMHVNLSPRQITQPRFHENLLESIVKASVPPERLTCEITESVLIQSFDTAKNSLEELSQHGIQICLDDFGTGYSSLSYLHSFPFDAMKLDRSFTKDMENSEKARNLVQSVLNLAHGLGFDLVAEGIETQAQLQTLLELGYQKGQGYLFSPPLDTADIVGFVEQFQFPVIKDKTH